MILLIVDKTKQMFNIGYFDCDRLVWKAKWCKIQESKFDQIQG